MTVRATQYITLESFNEHVRPGATVCVGHPADQGSWAGTVLEPASQDDDGVVAVLVQRTASISGPGANVVTGLEDIPINRVWVPDNEAAPATTDEWFLRMPIGTAVDCWDRDRRGYLSARTTEPPYMRGDRNIVVPTSRGTFRIECVAPRRSYDGIESPVTLHTENVRPVMERRDETEDRRVTPAYAPNILRDALDNIEAHVTDRDDAATGKRAGAHAARLFNAITPACLTERDVWLMQLCLKLARAEVGVRNADPNPDDYIDGAAYMALAGEAALRANKPGSDGEGDASAE